MIKPGIYEHYKGGRYRVITLAKMEENLEDVVVYESLKDKTVWVRTLKVFTEKFKYIGENPELT